MSRHHDHPEASSVSAVELCLQGGEGWSEPRDVTSPFWQSHGKEGTVCGTKRPSMGPKHMEFKIFQGKDLTGGRLDVEDGVKVR